MQEAVQRMIDNVDRTAAVYEQILEVERGKQRAIVAGEIDALTEIVGREETLVALAAELEAARTALRARLAECDERLGPDARLHHLIELLEGPQRDHLARRRQHLLALASQINDVNRTNFQLLRCSLDLLREVLDTVFGAAPAPNTYDPKGQQEAGPHDPTRVDHVL